MKMIITTADVIAMLRLVPPNENECETWIQYLLRLVYLGLLAVEEVEYMATQYECYMNQPVSAV